MKTMYVVNASPLLSDDDVRATVTPLQTQIDRDFMPIWQSRMVESHIKVEFAGTKDIPDLPDTCWPIFLNRHSNDPGALGWHDDDPAQNIRIYSRVFVGDCMQLNLNWQTTLSHEALELIGDPDIRRVWKMPDGRLAAYEMCDAVEADDQAYDIAGFAASNFVLPNYFSMSRHGPFDFRHKLHHACPSLTPGGYMSVTDRSGNWQQLTMDRANGLMGRRAAMNGHRRLLRSRIPVDQLEIVK